MKRTLVSIVSLDEKDTSWPEIDVSGHESEGKSGIKFGLHTQKTAPLKQTLFLRVVKKRRVYSQWEVFQYLGLLEHLKR